MRPSNKDLFVVKSLTVKVPAETEHLISISEYKESHTVVAVVQYRDSSGADIGQRKWYITGDHYTLLTSESPDFAPGKPANEYREIDLWYIIDKLEEEGTV